MRTYFGWNYSNITAATGFSPASGSYKALGFPAITGDVPHWLTSQRLYFVGADSHIHELVSTDFDPGNASAWTVNDLMVLAGCPATASAQTCPCGYFFKSQNVVHLFYIGADGDIYELYLSNGVWAYNNLNAASGAPQPQAPNGPGSPSRLAACAWESKGTQHVFYMLGSQYMPGGQIFELSWSASAGWQWKNLTAQTGDTLVQFGDPTAYVWEGNGTIHFVYCDTYGNVQELYSFDDVSWFTNAVFERGFGEFLCLTGFVWDSNNSEHIVYNTRPLLVEMINTPGGSGWSETGLAVASSPIINNTQYGAGSSTPVGYVWDNTEHIVLPSAPYGSSGVELIMEFYGSRNNWTANPLTLVTAGASTPSSSFTTCGAYVWDALNGSSEYVAYIDANNNICVLSYGYTQIPDPPPII